VFAYFLIKKLEISAGKSAVRLKLSGRVSSFA
jgi:hypothetical protein